MDRSTPELRLFAAAAGIRFGTGSTPRIMGTVAALLLATSAPALAAGECGAPSGGNVTCTPAGNPYANGIQYLTAQDLTLGLADGVIVNKPGPVPTPGVSLNAGPAGLSVAVNVADGATVTTNGSGQIGVLVSAATQGDITLNNAGVVTANGFSSVGLLAITSATAGSAQASTITIGNSGSVSTNGGGGGIVGVIGRPLFSGTFNPGGGTISIDNSGDVTTMAGGAGIGAVGFGNDIDIDVANSGSVLTEGEGSAGIAATLIGAGGSIGVANSGDIVTQGDGSTGIFASGTSDIVVSGDGNVTTSGDDADGIVANGVNVTVDVGGLVATSGANSDGVDIAATGGTASATVNDVTTLGAGSRGVVVQAIDGGEGGMDTFAILAPGDAEAVVNGAVSTSGPDSIGVEVTSETGVAYVTNNGSVTTAGTNSSGIMVYGFAGASVDGTGSVLTLNDNSAGIVAGTEFGDVTVSAADVTTQGAGSSALVAGALFGNVSIDSGSILTTGAGSTGLTAFALNGNVDIASDEVVTSGDSSIGVFALAALAGDITIDAGSVNTSGDNSDGIFAVGVGYSNIDISAGEVVTSGDYSAGIVATTSYYGGYGGGSVTIADAEPDFDNITIDVDRVQTAGIESGGVSAVTTYGDIDVTAGTVITAGARSDGIFAEVGYGGAVSVDAGSVTTSGAESAGIYATSAYGGVTVDADSVTTSGADSVGIFAGAYYGDVSVTAGNVQTSGAASDGIYAGTYGGSTTVTSGTVRVTGAGSVGIYAAAEGDVVVNAGTTTAASGNAIEAYAYYGSAQVAVTGNTTSGTANAIEAFGYDGVKVTVGSGATVQGGANGIVVTTPTLIIGEGGGTPALAAAALAVAPLAFETGGSTVVNNGTITGGTGFAILAAGGSTLVTNNGTINGRIALTDEDDVVANAGTFNALGDSSFGLGSDLFTNSGTLRVRPGAAAAGSVTFTGLETFNNSGLIDLRNGRTGDTLMLDGTAFTGSGGSALALDVPLGSAAGAGDLLVVGTAAGSTQVVVNNTSGGPLLTAGRVIVDAQAASSPTAFGVASGSADQGFVHYDIVYNPAATNYALVGTPGAPVYRLLKYSEGATNIWYKSSDVWSGHLREFRDTRESAEAGARLWGQIHGSLEKRRSSVDSTVFGFSDTFDIGYKQDYFGGQLGVDFVPADAGSVVFGITGGYIDSKLRFSGVADRVDYEAVNLGAYAAFNAGPLFANLLGKYDKYWIKAKGFDAGYATDLDGYAFGATAEVGFHGGTDSFFFEPVASVSWVRTKIDGFSALSSDIDFDKTTSVRGKAGLRVGGKLGEKASFYAGGNVVKEFKGRDGIRFVNNSIVVDLDNDRPPLYGEALLGFNAVSAGGVTGFVEAFGTFGKKDAPRGGGGRAGISIKF